MGNQVLKVFATRDDEAAAVALSSLICALDELDVVAIVRYAYDKRTNPHVGVAFPHIKHNYESKKKNQVTAQDIFQDNHKDGPTSKKLMTEKGRAHFSVTSLAEGSVTSAGSVNPAENFCVLVKQKNANFEEASDQLINHIKQFLDTNETPYFKKSMDCIRAFQEEAVKFSEDQCFNNFLKAL
ncbi:X-ray repair cross-complementing protein 5 [Plecturocebus cupreus]